MQIPLTDKSKFQGSIQASHLRTSLSKVTGRKFKTDTEVCINMQTQGFPGGAVVENLPADAGDTGSSPGLGRSHMPRSN